MTLQKKGFQSMIYKRFFIFSVLVLSFHYSLNAQARIAINIDSPSGNSLPIAITSLVSLDGNEENFFSKFETILERDLKMSGLFKILPKESFLESPSAGITSDNTQFHLWKKTGADALIKGGYKKQGQSYVLEVRLFDVQQQSSILGKRYYFARENFSNAVHTFADQIIEELTGQKGVFSTTRILAIGTAGKNKEIFEMSIDGSDLVQITRHRSITLSPAWSKNGRFIAFTSFVSKNPDLFLFDRKKRKEKRISARQGLNYGADFSPKDEKIALAMSNDSDQEIVLINYRGRILKSLTQNWWIDIEPSFSPDGKTIGFVSNQPGLPQIYSIGADGSNLKRLTYKGYHNVSPAWSPDGKWIAFAGRESGKFDIFIMKPNGTSIKRLTRNAGNNESPSWSPNGQMIAFSSDRTSKEQIFVMSWDGRGQTQITDGVGRFTSPSWSPILE